MVNWNWDFEGLTVIKAPEIEFMGDRVDCSFREVL